MKNLVAKNLIIGLHENLGARKYKENLVVIESDDWGSIRSNNLLLEAEDNFSATLISNSYKYDALETVADLSELFSVLSKYRGVDGNPACLNANYIMANPDFGKIKATRYEEYSYKDLKESYSDIGQDPIEIQEVLREAASLRLFHAELHGREHFNIFRWLDRLRNSSKAALGSFELGVVDIGQETVMDALNFDDYDFAKAYFHDAVHLFKEFFDYIPQSFVPPKYHLPLSYMPLLKENKIRQIQGRKYLLNFYKDGKKESYGKRYSGKKSIYGIYDSVRNVHFEPTISNPDMWLKSAKIRVDLAFYLNVPAIISTHRTNYIMSLNKEHGKLGLEYLSRLLDYITKKHRVKFKKSIDLIDCEDY